MLIAIKTEDINSKIYARANPYNLINFIFYFNYHN